MSAAWLTVDAIKADKPHACVGGPFGSELTTRDYVDHGVPVIRGNNLAGDSGFQDADFVFVSEQKAATLASNIAYPGDVIFTQRGTLGQVCLIPSDAHYERYVVSQSQMKLSVNLSLALPEFVYYWFLQTTIVEAIKRRAISSGVPHINLGIFKSLPLRIPPLVDQKRIVGTLRDLDRLAENNRRRIQLLEQSARLLYREWFVHLRFPRHEHVKAIDRVPRGWQRSPLPEVMALNPRERLEADAPAWYVPMASLSESGMASDRTLFERRYSHTSVRFRNDDVLVARITPCLENGKTAFVNFLSPGEVACGSTEFIVMRGKGVSPYFTYCLARTYDFREHAIKSMVGSSGRQRVQVSCFAEYGVLVPPRPIRDEFDSVCRDLFDQIRILTEQNYRLAQARGLLLPRLMSGEIEV